MKKLCTIDLSTPHVDFIEITNVSWASYNLIMVSIDSTIKQLNNPIEDLYLESKRQGLIEKYQELFDRLKTEIPWRGESIDINDQIIQASKLYK